MERILQYVHNLKLTIDQLPKDQILRVIDVLRQARLNGKRVFIMGNGGSASTASHFVCDLSKNTRQSGVPAFKVIGLTDNVASITAYGNDEGYDQVFAQQLANLVQAGDIVIAISASGNSPNVLRAVEVAREANAFTIGFTGFDGGRLGKMVDLNLWVQSDCIEQVEDLHLVLEHMICKVLRDEAANLSMQSANLSQTPANV